MASLRRDGDADVLPVGGEAAATTDVYGIIYSGGAAAIGADGSGICCSSTYCCRGDRHVYLPVVSSKGVAEAPASSAGAASVAVPAAAPATGGTVFPTASVGGAARAPASSDGVALTGAPATGGTIRSAASVEGARRQL